MIAGRWLTEIAKPFLVARLASQNRGAPPRRPALPIMGRLGIGDIEQFAGARQHIMRSGRNEKIQIFGRGRGALFGLAVRGRLGVNVHLVISLLVPDCRPGSCWWSGRGLDPGLPVACKALGVLRT